MVTLGLHIVTVTSMDDADTDESPDEIDDPEDSERCSICWKPVVADASGVKVWPGQAPQPLPWKHLDAAANADHQATVRA